MARKHRETKDTQRLRMPVKHNTMTLTLQIHNENKVKNHSTPPAQTTITENDKKEKQQYNRARNQQLKGKKYESDK